MKVKEWMTPEPKSVEANDPVKAAVNLVVENRIRHLPVVRGDALVGIISDRDLKTRNAFDRRRGDGRGVRDLHGGDARRAGHDCESDRLRARRRIWSTWCGSSVEKKVGAIPVVAEPAVWWAS